MTRLEELDKKFDDGELSHIELAIWWLQDKNSQEQALQELDELRPKQVGKPKIELYREIFYLSNYIKHIAGISNTSVKHYWPDTCEVCKEIKIELKKNDSRINRLLSLLDEKK